MKSTKSFFGHRAILKNQTISDFRATRKKLPPDAFAFFEGPERSPSDLVSTDTWWSIVSLPDDVSLRTSDHYGSTLTSLWDLWREWICVVGALQNEARGPHDSPIARVACDATDYFQASIYGAPVGFYRLGFASLRAVIECMTIAMQFELAGDQQTFLDWLAGEEFGFGRAADLCRSNSTIRALEHDLTVAVGDDLFHQRQGGIDEGGFARRLFRKLSAYAHGTPGFTDGDMWQSNGPIFVPEAFETWNETFLSVLALAVLEARLAQPKLSELGFGSELQVEDLFTRTVKLIPTTSETRRLFEAVPITVWRG